MTMASRLQSCLTQNQSRYDVLQHRASHSSRETARHAGIPPERVAKSVILDDAEGHWLMAVLPANRRVNLDKVQQLTKRSWRLATEIKLDHHFNDCATGAIPPVGSAYGIPALIDHALMSAGDVYFEAGDHEALVHMSTEQFLKLMPGAQRAPFSEENS